LQGVLLGLSNTAGVLAGVFGTAATGYILQRGKQTIHPLHEKKYELLLYWCISSGFSSFVMSKWSQRGSLDDSGANTVGAKETICHLKFAFLMNFLCQLTYSFQLFFL